MHICTFDLQCPFGWTGHVQSTESSVGSVRVRADRQEIDITVVMWMIWANPRNLEQT